MRTPPGYRIGAAHERIPYLVDIAMVKEGSQTPGDVLLAAAVELAELLRSEEPH
jgi:hypothetical protein